MTDAPIDQALQQARELYSSKRPMSLQAHQEATGVMPGGNTRTVLFHGPFPLRIKSGSGSTIYDVDGNQYANFLGEYTAGLFGHTHPVIRKAIDEALDAGINLSAHNPNEIKLATLVCDRFPSIERVRFTNSGTEANLMAVSTARFTSRREKVLVFKGGYHGGLLYFANGSGIPINAPFPFVLGEYNNIDHTKAVIEQHKDDLACILVEPMLGSAGCIPAKKEFLQYLRNECTRSGIKLIFDEVMTSRLSPSGGQEYYDVFPDMTTLGKYIGGGMSFGAFGGSEIVMSMYDPTGEHFLPHAGTFNNNSLTMSAGVAAMSQVFTPIEAKKLTEKGEQFRQDLNEIIQTLNLPLQFTGIGSLMNLHATRDTIQSPNDLTNSDDRIKELIFLDLLEQGIYMARRGFIALMLPVTDDQILNFKDVFRTTLENRRVLFS